MSQSPLNISVSEKVEEAPGFLLWQIEMSWQRLANQLLANYRLTYTQFIVLYIGQCLAETNENVYQHQVAKFSRIDRMMTSRILASLEKKNFIERIKLSGDARAKLVNLTPQGKTVLMQSLRAITEAENVFFKPGGQLFVKSMESILSESNAHSTI